MDLQQTHREVLDFLDRHRIPYEHYVHERTHTLNECLQLPFITDDVTICKNILLCNRQETNYYLLLLNPTSPFRTSVVSKLLGSSRLSFAPDCALENKLHLTSGSLSPLGLIFDLENQIILCADSKVKQTSKIAFHPCDNRSTVVFEQEVFWQQVVPLLKNKMVCIEIPESN